MKLAKIPQILDLLVEEKIISKGQQETILQKLSNLKKEGKQGFAGEIGIELGFYTKDILDKYLKKQTVLKAEAAIEDIQTIIKDGTQEVPQWLKANWGNNGVNPASKNITIADGISAAANIAQNLVMVANENPQLAKEIQNAVVAAANFARGLYDGNSDKVPLFRFQNIWCVRIDAILRLLEVVDLETQYIFKDQSGKEINIKDFIQERFKEINTAIDILKTQTKEKQTQISI